MNFENDILPNKQQSDINLENWCKTKKSLKSKIQRIKAKNKNLDFSEILSMIKKRDILRFTVIVDSSKLLDAVKHFVEKYKGLIRIKQT